MKRLLLILLVISSWLIPQPVYAATQDRVIASEGTDTGGTYVGGAVDYTVLNDGLDTTYLRSGASSSYYYHSWNMQDFVTGYAAINGVGVTFRCARSTINNSITPYVLIGGTKYYGTIQYSSGTPTTFTEYTFGGVTNKNPATGLAWDSTALNAVEWGIRLFGDSTPTWYAFLYEYKITVDYSAVTVPILSTSAVTSNTNNSATLNGTITSNGGSAITDYGFVWDTVSRADPGNTAPTASAYASKWENGATVAVGAIAHSTGATLTENTVYYYRSAAENAIGWSYGSELSFKTVGDPSITTLAATLIATTTVRINALVTDANGQLCDVRFGYGTTTQATVAAYDTQTAWVNDTYATGTYPYVDITGLTAATPYFFRVAIKNDAGTVEGGELTFTTSSGINEPVSIIAIPASTTISLSWVKGTGASTSWVRYSTGTYPATTVDGALAYSGTGSSVLITGLASGTTYYVSIWGKTGLLYSAAAKTVLTTTSAYGIAPTTTPPTPTTPSTLYQNPDSTKVSGIPVIEPFVAFVAPIYGMSENMIWYLIYLVLAVGAGIFVYRKTSSPWFTLIAVILMMGIGVTLNLVALMIVILFIIIGVSIMHTGERR